METNQKKFDVLKLSMEFSSISYNVKNNKIYFYIKGYTSKENDYEIIENSKINVEILVNNNETFEKINSVCSTGDIDASKGSYVYLSCSTDYRYEINSIYLSIDSNGFSNDIEFENKKENIIFYDINEYNAVNDNKSSNKDKNNENKDDKNSSKYIRIFNLFILILIL